MPPEFLPGHTSADDPRARCDFCTVHSPSLAGAMEFPLDRELQVDRLELQPVQLAAGVRGVGLNVRRTIAHVGIWGACAICAPVVARRDPSVLATHVLAEWVGAGKLVKAEDLVAVQSFFRVLLPALGPPRPYHPPVS
jgi:hypothetical protein